MFASDNALFEPIAEPRIERRVEVAPLPERKRYDARYMPVMGVSQRQISDNFGVPRNGGRRHKGIDIMAPSGRPLIAVTSGRIEYTSSKLGGKSVWLHGDDGLRYYYAHLSRYEGSAPNGGRVQPGQIVGYVGNTGNARSTPAHLHMEIRRNGETVNPYSVLKSKDHAVIPVGGETTGGSQYAARTAPSESTVGKARRSGNTVSKSSKSSSKKIAARSTAKKSKLSAKRSKSTLAAKKSLKSKKQLASRRSKARKYAAK